MDNHVGTWLSNLSETILEGCLLFRLTKELLLSIHLSIGIGNRINTQRKQQQQQGHCAM